MLPPKRYWSPGSQEPGLGPRWKCGLCRHSEEAGLDEATRVGPQPPTTVWDSDRGRTPGDSGSRGRSGVAMAPVGSWWRQTGPALGAQGSSAPRTPRNSWNVRCGAKTAGFWCVSRRFGPFVTATLGHRHEWRSRSRPGHQAPARGPGHALQVQTAQLRGGAEAAGPRRDALRAGEAPAQLAT